MSARVDYEAVLAALRARFESELAQQLEEIRTLARAVDVDPSALRRLRFAVHNLAGIAGSFGHPLLSRAAQGMDGLLGDSAPGRPDSATLTALADRLRPDAAAQGPAAADPASPGDDVSPAGAGPDQHPA